jgi:hypothetical protein
MNLKAMVFHSVGYWEKMIYILSVSSYPSPILPTFRYTKTAWYTYNRADLYLFFNCWCSPPKFQLKSPMFRPKVLDMGGKKQFPYMVCHHPVWNLILSGVWALTYYSITTVPASTFLKYVIVYRLLSPWWDELLSDWNIVLLSCVLLYFLRWGEQGVCVTFS